MSAPPPWQPGTQYNYGDIVVYESARYKIIQPHFSQGDWAPPIVPALWGRIPDDEWQKHEPYNPPHDKGDYHGQDVHQPDDCTKHPDRTEEVTHEEQKKKWWDLDDNRKKQLELGGGLLAGAAAIGAGYYAWHEHENKKTEEEKQALTWGVQGWQTDAYARTQEVRNHGPRAPTTWVLVEGREKIPPSAIEAGRDKDNHPIYIARAYFEDSLQIGKASQVFKEGAAIGYGGRVVELNKFEVLIGDPKGIRWVSYSYQLDLQRLGATPVEGGKEANGTPLYIARVKYSGGVHTAKVGTHLPAAQLAFSGTEVSVEDYEVLCLN
ncbi:hypothetical protein DFH94DRAFT_843948 [Russula ochroleuca]|jgi:hypothetical protein|uniref:Chitin-binding type-3 domain-containing protein n=1 Tax=Russula ochroleuca TaxID=152965 RepID=A0A9P5N063_9AGAM|nr:hypothetical protein DFH94DRAFT_843948 [Russula ochroleuca]